MPAPVIGADERRTCSALTTSTLTSCISAAAGRGVVPAIRLAYKNISGRRHAQARLDALPHDSSSANQ